MQHGGPVMAAPASPVSVMVNGSPVALKTTTADLSVSPTSPVPHVVRVSVVPASAAVSPQSPATAATTAESDERSSSGASSGTGSDDEAPYDSDSGAEMKFHLRELEDTPSSSPDGSGVSCGRPLDVEKAILSRQGTVRGVRNLVRASIKCIADCQEGKVSSGESSFAHMRRSLGHTYANAERSRTSLCSCPAVRL
ncbi:hypothetical protein HPB51_016783 [Rhipicephalus microplus]|uniref:Uncharacterized protein n=1 Tax=Rhipicephalus microplus TaxID=6941 RepID=A0A9J6DVS9_RHIMP|nr:hypothetical protein HPB51_016783 [Rhipicephalus microplus]